MPEDSSKMEISDSNADTSVEATQKTFSAEKAEEASEVASSPSSNPESPSQRVSPEILDHTTSDETIEDRSSDTSSDQANLKTSRELKSILALSKEAKLNTNISHKRKSSDIIKGKETNNSPIKLYSHGDFDGLERKGVKRFSTDSKYTKFPVTAEAELECSVMVSETVKSTDKNIVDILKRKKDHSSDVVEGASDGLTKRSRQSSFSDGSSSKMRKDGFCWRCHRDGINISCETCPRSYHHRCLKQTIPDNEHWACPECVSILKAESTQTRSEAMKGMSLEHLCGLLKFALKRMIKCHDSQPFINPVSETDFPDYKRYIVQPMYLSLLEKNIKENLYGSTQAFEADAKWILHNSIIFNSYQSKLTSVAKSMIKICKQEMAEIENCPSCYLNANTRKETWFVEVCPKPHILVWAKLKGFPYWPAKAMCTNAAGMVDVRFFGAHDRAWVPSKECYLYCRRDPNSHKQKKNDINECVKELEIYIDNLRKVYGEFHYAPFKMPFDPPNEMKQLQIFLPRYRPDHKVKTVKTKYFSKSSDFNMSPNSSPEPSSKEDNSIKKQPIEKVLKPKAEDTDNTMEGYGTDDESLLTSQMYNNTLTRFRQENSDAEADDEDVEDKIESEPEDESYLKPNPLSFDTSPMRGKVRTRGGLNSGIGKLKVIPRLITHGEDPSDDVFEDSPTKVSRRNSDQSVKSESSRLSNLSDKISRIDIPENMEVSLGNSKGGCLSISEVGSDNSEIMTEKPSHNNVDEDIEVKKKPVQVQIQNDELSLAPQKKFKMSEHLIRRFTQAEAKNAENNANESISGNGVLCSLPDSSGNPSEKQLPTQQETINCVENLVKDGISSSITEHVSPVKSGDLSKKDDESARNPDSSMQIESNEVVDKDTKRELIIRVSNETLTARTSPCLDSDSESTEVTEEDRTILMNTTTLPSSCGAKSCDSTEQIPDAIAKSSTDSVPNSEVIGETNLVEDKQSDSNKLLVNIDSGEPSVNVMNSSQDQSTLDADVGNQVAVIEHVDDSDESLDDSQIDEANIRNIIHSSLNENPNITKSSIVEPLSDCASEKQLVNQKRKSIDDNTTHNVPRKLMRLLASNSAQKVVMPKDKMSLGKTPAPGSKSVIHPFLAANFFKKNSPGKSHKLTPSEQPIAQLSMTSSNGIESAEEPMIVDIKSEPESDSETPRNESDYMEAKRQYMSALNISEKLSTKARTPEIRTRSKTEEFRFKPVDNLSKVINDVATNSKSNIDGKDDSSSKKNDKTICVDEKQIYVKPLCQMQEPHRQRARKSFPKPNYSAPPKPATVLKPLKNDNLQVSLLKKTSAGPSTSSEKQKPNDLPGTTSNLILLTQPQSTVASIALLPPNQTITYSLGTPMLAVMSQPTTTTTTLLTKPILKPVNVKALKSQNINASQNYIPQNESTKSSTPSPSETSTESTNNTATLIHNLLANPIVSSANQSNASDDYHESSVPATSEEFTILNGILPDNICKEVSNLLARPPPKLKPRPPGPLSTSFEEGAPSAAGPVTAKINSIAHRLNDYFRGMVVELLEDFSKTDNKEATISLLKAEIESLKHAHSVEVTEIKKNICITLKDIQKSIVEDRERIIDETRAACEAEAIKRIEDAKSKQWCANCSKEAQFYCCWNTSYCDYPCQQKHWIKHMGKCTQSSNNQQPPTTVRSGAPQYIIKPATSKDARRIIGKPTKVYVNRSLVSKSVPAYKATPGGQLTLLESTPGNYELQGVGPISVSGKIISTSIVSMVKSTNVTSSPSTSSASGSNSSVSKHSSVIQAKSPPSIIPARSITTLSDDSE